MCMTSRYFLFSFPSFSFNSQWKCWIRNLGIKGGSNFRVYTLSQQNNLQYNIPSAEAEGALLKAWNLLWIEQWVNRSTFTWILRTFCKDNLKHLLSFSIGFWAFNLNANSVLNVMWCELISPSSISNLWQTSLTHTWPAPVNRHRTIQFNFNPELKTIETDNLNNWVESEWRLEFDCVLYCVVRTRTALVTLQMGRDIIADLRVYLFTANTLTAQPPYHKKVIVKSFSSVVQKYDRIIWKAGCPILQKVCLAEQDNYVGGRQITANCSHVTHSNIEQSEDTPISAINLQYYI